MEEFVVKDVVYRIKKMNAIEILSLQNQISFNDYKESKKTIETMLEFIEVKIKDKWFSVKEKDNYLPVGIEDDLKSVQELISKMINYIKEVFQKSNI